MMGQNESRYNGPANASIAAEGSPSGAVNASGTNTLSKATSPDPVPRMPTVFQVSTMLASWRGTKATRTDGASSPVVLYRSFDDSVNKTNIQSACRLPLTKATWPDIRKPSAVRIAEQGGKA